MSASQNDLTEGGILKKLLIIAAPLMGTQLMMMAYNLADMFWLGRLSADAVAASGTGGMFLWLSYGVLLLSSMGTEIGISQNAGRKDFDTAKRFAQNGLMFVLALGILYGGALVFFNRPLVGIFNIQEIEVAEAAMAYIGISGLSMPLTFVSAVCKGMYVSTGNSRLPFYINTIGLGANIILDPIFIFTFGWGIEGAAVATVVAQGIVCSMSLLAVKFWKDRPFESIKFFVKPDFSILSRILRWSLPVAMESLLFTLLSIVIARMVTSFGVNAMAVQRIGSQIESLSWLIGGGFGLAVTAFMGQNYGAKKWGRMRRGYRISVLAMLGWGLIVMAGLATGGYLLYGVFIKDTVIQSMGADYLRILSLCQIPMCIEAAAGGMFRGSGRTVPPSLASITTNVIRIPIVYYLCNGPLGLDGIWWGISICTIIRGMWVFLWSLIVQHKRPRHDAEAAAIITP